MSYAQRRSANRGLAALFAILIIGMCVDLRGASGDLRGASGDLRGASGDLRAENSGIPRGVECWDLHAQQNVEIFVVDLDGLSTVKPERYANRVVWITIHENAYSSYAQCVLE